MRKRARRKKKKSNDSALGLCMAILLEVIFCGSYIFVSLLDDKGLFTLTLYMMFFFYLCVLICFHRQFSFHEFAKNFIDWKGFILPVLLTAVGMALARAVSQFLLARIFVGSVRIVLPLAFSSSVFETVLFAVTVMILQPVGEELFYRKAMINFDSGWLCALTLILGLTLQAIARSYTPAVIVETVILALPLVISYLVTKNIYVPLFVHLIFNIIIYMPDVIYDFARLATA